MQERKNSSQKTPTRKDLNEDFPLRSFVTCGSCEQPMTSCWSKGRHRKYPYYLCDTRGCPDYRKSIRKEKIEGEFETILKQLVPSHNLFALAFEGFRNFWNEKLESADQEKTSLKRAITEMDNKTAQLIDRLVSADSPALIEAYETRLKEMEQEKIIWKEKLSETGKPRGHFKEVYRTAFEFLSNPWSLWVSDHFEDRRAVQKLVFAERLPYDRNKGYRTAKTSIVFNALEAFRMEKSDMVIPAEIAQSFGFNRIVRGAGRITPIDSINEFQCPPRTFWSINTKTALQKQRQIMGLTKLANPFYLANFQHPRPHQNLGGSPLSDYSSPSHAKKTTWSIKPLK